MDNGHDALSWTCNWEPVEQGFVVVGNTTDDEQGESAIFRQAEDGSKRCKLSLQTKGREGTAQVVSNATWCEILIATADCTDCYSGTARACRLDDGHHVIDVPVRPSMGTVTLNMCGLKPKTEFRLQRVTLLPAAPSSGAQPSSSSSTSMPASQIEEVQKLLQAHSMQGTAAQQQGADPRRQFMSALAHAALSQRKGSGGEVQPSVSAASQGGDDAKLVTHMTQLFDELKAHIDRRLSAMEASLKQHVDDRLARLEESLVGR